MPDVMTTTDVPWLPIPDDDGPVSLNRLGDLQRQLRFPVLMDWSGVQLYSNVAPTCEPPEALAEVCRSVQARCDEFGEACATAMDIIDSIGRAELDRMVYSGAAVDLDAMLRQACQHAAKVASHWRPEHPIDWCGPAGDWADFIPRLEEWMRRAASGGKFAAAELAHADSTERATERTTARTDEPQIALEEAFAIRDEDLTIMAEIHERKTLVKGSEIDGCSGLPGRKRLYERLQAMERATPPLIERPGNKKRSGYRLTTHGVAALRHHHLLQEELPQH